MKLYGITTCDTVRKARKQLEQSGTDYAFIDLKTAELPETLLSDWLDQCPETLVNKRSTSYRQIKSDWLAAAGQRRQQIRLIQANPMVLKRPIIVTRDGHVSVGMPPELRKGQN